MASADGNFEEQDEEILALQSIFENTDLEDGCDTVSFRFKNRTAENRNFVGEFSVTPKIYSGDAVKISYENSFCGDGERNKKEFSIRYLPPIRFRFTLPDDYPSTGPPVFSVTCQVGPRGYKLSQLE